MPSTPHSSHRARSKAAAALLIATALLIAAALWPLLAPPARAGAPPAMSLVRLGAEQGLSQGAIMAVAQDGRGFLWLGTEDGLNRYDGLELRHYISRRNDPATVPNNWISALATDAQGRLWVGTDGGGLVGLDAQTSHFKPVLSARGQPLLGSQTQIRSLFVDRQQRLWVATRQAGIFAVDIAKHTVREYRRDPASPNTLSSAAVFAFSQDTRGQIWLGSDSGLDRLDPDSARVESFGAALRKAVDVAGESVKVNAVYADKQDTIWVGSDNGLFALNVRGSVTMAFKHDAKDPDSLPSDRVTSLLEDTEGRLWVGTSAGLVLLDRSSGKLNVFRNVPADLGSLPDNHIVSLYQDHSGLLWIGTKSGGAARWNPRSWAFGHHRFLETERNNITAFASDRHGTLWLGSFGGGISAIDKATGAVRSITQRSRAPLRLDDDNIMALLVDERDRLWAGTMGAGVERLDVRSGTVKRFAHDPANAATLPAAGVMSMLRDSRGMIWIGTYGGGIARIDPRDDSIFRYPVAKDGAAGLSSDRATALAEDAAGLIWIGTDSGGLNVLDPLTGRFHTYNHAPHDSASLSSNTVYALHIDKAGRVWVGTRGGGLDCITGSPFSSVGVKFRNISENDGLPNSTIYGIEPDSAGRLWLSSNRGLAVYNPQTLVFTTFRRSHGLQGDEFNFGAHYSSPDGTLYFGGSNGYNGFLPQRLSVNSHPPQIALTELLRANKPVSSAPETVRDLRLGYRDNAVTIRFAALDFTGPAENRYSYRLQGFESQWVDAGNRGHATYTNLEAGHYRFLMRAANSDGVWNDAGLSIGLDVAPPPWATWWARLSYLCAIAGITFAAWRTQQRRLDDKAAYARALQSEVNARTAELSERNEQLQFANKALHSASITDPLTGLGNRRCLRDALVEMRAANLQSAGVLMIVDLDYLKPINDKYGHDAGDAVLIRVAEILRQVFRPTDVIVRWGGDEFVVFCRACDLTTAGVLAERTRAAIAKTIFRVGEGAVTRTSCSIGFAAEPFIPRAPQALGWEQSMNLADEALYRAKRERNCWFGWGGTPASLTVPSLLTALEKYSVELERDGVIEVRRRPPDADDTIDHLRKLGGPDSP